MSDERLLEAITALQAQVAEVREKLTYREKILVGWKDIGQHVGYSADHAQELSKDPFDPLPVWHRGGFTESSATMLDAWLFRRRIPAQKRRARALEVESRKSQLDMFGEAQGPKRGRSKGGGMS